MIVTAHSPNYLPGTSVLAKVARSDAVIWLDEMRFTTPGYVNRNQLPDGTWLTVPVNRPNHRARVSQVTIAGNEWAPDHVRELLVRYEETDHFDDLLVQFIGSRDWSGAPLVDLTRPLIDRLLDDAGVKPRQVMQSDFNFGGTSLSDKQARMVAALGDGTEPMIYLSGPKGREFLDPKAFERLGVELAFFEYSGQNHTAVDPLFTTGTLPTQTADGHFEAVVAQ